MLLLNHVSYNMIKMSVRSKITLEHAFRFGFKKIKYKVIDSHHSILLDAMPVL